MSKLILVSFADSRFKNSLLRVEKQTEGFPFDERHFHTEKNCFDKQYWRDLKPWLYRRGFGYWHWKFKLVLYYLQKLEYGDMLFFSDAGISWNNSSNAIRLFNEHIGRICEASDLLVFSQPTIEQEWTKGDILHVCGVYDNQEICLSRQFFSGFFCIRKTDEMVRLISKVVELSALDKELITDKRSQMPNKPGFRENRHDQSLFSVLAKLHSYVEIKYSEHYELDEMGTEIVDCPIQVIRNKEVERNIKAIVKNKLLRPWREILNLYFRRIRDYDYIGGFPW